MKFNQADKAIESLTDTTYKQAEKGFKKYGQELDPLEPGRNWLQMQAEEFADANQYRQAMEDRMEFVIGRIKRITDNDEIHALLDYMVGR